MHIWERILEVFAIDQQPSIAYLQNTYMCIRHQWANCYTSQYRNWGLRTSSPLESNHRTVKANLISSKGDLYRLERSVSRMVVEARETYTSTLSRSRNRVRFEFLRAEWLGELPLRCTTLALDILKDQYRRAAGHLAQPGNPIPRPIPNNHVCTMPIQYGLPCFCQIYRNIELTADHPRITALRIDEIDPFWYTGVDMGEEDPLLRVREPHIAQVRGRPPQNSAVTLPEALRLEGYERHRRRQFAPDLHRTPSQWERSAIPSERGRGISRVRAETRSERGRAITRVRTGIQSEHGRSTSRTQARAAGRATLRNQGVRSHASGGHRGHFLGERARGTATQLLVNDILRRQQELQEQARNNR
ncbi:hypothetical protein F4861DRAFT_305667 [Xylaria intraflava]|nr:hypothetical protein F4861DRAFT_305667 [Xylaria intraflava]